MKIILFLALSLISESLTQPTDLSALDSSSCGLLLVPDVIPNEWIDPIELVPQNPLFQVEASDRIHQGVEADTRTMPWVVHITSQRRGFPDSGSIFTGVIISRLWVITAGHCMFYRNTVVHRYEWYGQKDHTIRAGPRNYVPDGFYLKIRSRNWFIRDDYRQQVADANHFNRTPAMPNDIALIRVDGQMNPVYESDTRRFLVNSICFPQPVSALDPNRVYQVAGYGLLGPNWNFHNLLMTYSTQIQTNYSVCQYRGFEHLFDWLRNSYGDHRFQMIDVYRNHPEDSRLVCTTQDQTHTKSCLGDSGGPLFNNRTQQDQMGNTRYELTGVVTGSLIGTTTPEAWIFFLNRYRAGGGNLPAWETFVAMANQIDPLFNSHWPCGVIPVFNVVNEYAPWIDHIIQTQSNVEEATGAWLYYTFFVMTSLGGSLYARHVGLRRQQPEPPLRPPFEGHFVQVEHQIWIPRAHPPQPVQQPPLDQP